MSNDKPPGVPLGSWNKVATVVGMRGEGKSTLAMELALRWRKEAGTAYVIGHSLGANFPTRMPNGYKPDITYHANVEDMAKALRRTPGRIHVVAEGTADRVIEYARKLSTDLRRSTWRREKGLFGGRWKTYSPMEGMMSVPIICIIDEAVSLRSAQGKANAVSKKKTDSDDPNREQDESDARWLRERLFRARHENIGYIFNIQNAQATGWVILDQSTDIYAFRTVHEWALGALRACGYTQEQCVQIRNLERYKRIHLQRQRT